jgi:signal transduction histidine kinase
MKLKTNDQQILSILKKVEFASKELFQGTREFMWTIDPDHDNLVEILIYLRDYGVDFFQNTNIDFEVGKNLLTGAEALPVQPGSCKHILAIFKEAMTNCLKHSHAAKVTLSSESTNHSFTIIFCDNGIGVREKMGRGLQNMQTRALKVNAILKCENMEQGFSVALKFNNLKIVI